jgi:hypothetical protein
MTIEEASAPKSQFEEENRAFWLEIRRALLILVSVVENRLNIEPRTSELREQRRQTKAN